MVKKIESKTTKCLNCEAYVVFHRRSCHVCEEPIGFPNVRFAEEEKSEMDARYQTALAVAKLQSTENEVKQFEDAVEHSSAIMARATSDVILMLSKNTQLLSTFAHQVESNLRVAEDNQWDRLRTSCESAIHPLYHEHIHYAVLSLNDYGVPDPTYGGCHLLLNETTIKNRATVFEENCFEFTNRHAVITGKLPPKGYRATWNDRKKLAVCKLSNRINASIDQSKYQELLISGTGKSSDFIEVHIYGDLHIHSVEKISITNNIEPEEKAMLNVYMKKHPHLQQVTPRTKRGTLCVH